MTLTSIRNFYRSHYADERGKAEESPGGSDAAMGSKASKQNGGSGAESRSDIVSSSQVGQPVRMQHDRHAFILLLTIGSAADFLFSTLRE